MDYKNFVLEYYKNAADGIHIHQVHNSSEANKLHSHEYFQIYYVKKGSLMHYINDNEAKLVVGDIFIVPPGIKHRILENADTVFYSLSFLPDTLDYMAEDSFCVNFLKSLKNEKGVRLKISLPSDEALRVETIIKEIYREFETQNIGSREILKSYILILISLFARRYYEDMPTVIPAQDIKRFMLHCIEYIKEHYYQEMKLDEIARLSAMSKTRFCSEFKLATGMPWEMDSKLF